jgi:hypothetical protein
MNWEPAHADHSIDRAVVILTWCKPIDPNTFDELVAAGRPRGSRISSATTGRLGVAPTAVTLALTSSN